jgi:tRNA nucleotidyltransferase/poly(A) polymerase
MTDARVLDNAPWLRSGPAARVLELLNEGGDEARVVGGAVRNALLGIRTGDIDIATTALPDEVIRRAKAAGVKSVPTGIEHGTVTLVVNAQPFEVTTLREDVETFGRKAKVAFGRDWVRDAERRDFTINGLSVDADGVVHDYVGGLEDIAAKRVRFIGDPDQRIAEDHLRILRFFRFYAWFGKPPLDGAGFDACRRNAGSLSSLSAERIAKELLRLLAAPAPADALEAMAEAGALDHWLPEYAGAARLKALIAREDTPDPLRRLAAIVSPPATAVAKRLKLSTQQSLRLQLMLEPAEPGDLENRRAALYRLGTSLFIDRVLLEGPDDWRAALALARNWTPPELPISGADALALGLKPGPQVGALLEAVERWWIAGDFSADRTACLAELKRLAHTA